jgi:hypothetical protein
MGIEDLFRLSPETSVTKTTRVIPGFTLVDGFLGGVIL